MDESGEVQPSEPDLSAVDLPGTGAAGLQEELDAARRQHEQQVRRQGGQGLVHLPQGPQLQLDGDGDGDGDGQAEAWQLAEGLTSDSSWREWMALLEGEVRAPFLEVSVRDFTGEVAQLKVRKQPGQEEARLLAGLGDKLDDEDEGKSGGSTGGGLFGAISSMWGGGSSGDAGKEAKKEKAGAEQAEPGAVQVQELGLGGVPDGGPDDDRIHVFSLASGHLYERFLRIMMLSVSKRSSRRVKFWLVENFLSPAFKRGVAAMALAKGFDVGLVTYKWPDWLRQQTEKQRIIWGYKILFLDVLFPLGLDRVIYVDADQVVRADLVELWDMDLQGAPYGYTPFCSSRNETLGF